MVVRNYCENCVYAIGFCECRPTWFKTGIDDKGNDIVTYCTMYEKDNGQYSRYLEEQEKMKNNKTL